MAGWPFLHNHLSMGRVTAAQSSCCTFFLSSVITDSMLLPLGTTQNIMRLTCYKSANDVTVVKPLLSQRSPASFFLSLSDNKGPWSFLLGGFGTAIYQKRATGPYKSLSRRDGLATPCRAEPNGCGPGFHSVDLLVLFIVLVCDLVSLSVL